MKAPRINNNISIIDTIEECGMSFFPDLWLKNNWLTIPEPKYNTQGNKEPDPKKAKEQEILNEVLKKYPYG